LFLTDAERAVRGLVLRGGVPPAVEVDDVRRRGQVQPRPAGLQRQHEKWHAVVLLESLDQGLPLPDGDFAVQDQTGPAKYRFQKRRQRAGHFAKLREDERLLLPGSDDLGKLAQARELAAIGFVPGAVAQPMRRMIADLLEPHQKRQNDAAALNSFTAIELLGQLRYGLLVKRGLLARQLA